MIEHFITKLKPVNLFHKKTTPKDRFFIERVGGITPHLRFRSDFVAPGSAKCFLSVAFIGVNKYVLPTETAKHIYLLLPVRLPLSNKI